MRPLRYRAALVPVAAAVLVLTGCEFTPPSGPVPVSPSGEAPVAPPPPLTPPPVSPPVSAPVSPPVVPPPVDPAGWTLLAQDDFSAPALDRQLWDTYEGTSGASGVTWTAGQVAVGDGTATVTVDTAANRGGAISTQGGVVQSYGKYEVRARIDEGPGAGFALLLWPTSNRWPQDGEIDFAEAPQRDRVHVTSHYQGPDGHAYHSGEFPLDATAWHTYGVEWTPQAITYLVDGQVRAVMTEDIPSGPMFLALQSEFDADCRLPGWWPCHRDTGTPATVRMQLDDVRIYAPAGQG